MAAACTELRLDHLPTDPLVHILSFLEFRDLVHCSYVNRRLNELSKHSPIWKTLCITHWLLTNADRLQNGVSWYCLFKQHYKDMGRYIQYYSTLKKAWDQLKSFLQQRCPRMITSLKEGATEAELDDIEAHIGCKLPDDYRCSYRIHNGQRLVVPGLMGSMSSSNHYRSEILLDVETAAGGFQQRRGMRRCLPLTFCFHTGLSQYIALQPAEGRRMFESFYPCPNKIAQDPSKIDMFITGSCFLEWFTTYVNNVVTGDYPIIRDQIFRYAGDKCCVAKTGDITVSVSTSFLPERSSVHPPSFIFSYRIRIEMSSRALRSAACQLNSRHWTTISNDNEKEMEGLGVVGEFPIMTPGKVHEYISCHTLATPSQYMEGYYTFQRLANKEEFFHVAIPRFHLVCPPIRVPVDTMQMPALNVASNFDDHDDDWEYFDGEGDDFGDLRGVNKAALEGAWCPQHI